MTLRALRRGVLAVVLAVILAFGARYVLTAPSHDRRWIPEQARLPRVLIDGSRVTIENVRDFPPDVPASPGVARYLTRSYDLDQLESAWFVLVPFSKAWRGPAHSFVSFGFRDGRYVAVSIEARREEGETYGLLLGLLRSFELIYVVGEERDLIGRRVAQSDHDMYLYELKTDPRVLRAALSGILRRIAQVGERPEFYDTLANNCTTNLIDQLNAIRPGAIGWSWKRLFPGYMDEIALNLGLVETSLSVDEARRRFRVNERVAKYLHADDFSRAIRLDVQ